MLKNLALVLVILSGFVTGSGAAFADPPFTWEEIHQIRMCRGEERCVGYDGYGGPCYRGYGGPLYDGYGGGCYAGYGGPLYEGYGGRLYNGYGGNCYKGYGGVCYDGYGGNCYGGYGGDGTKCPIQCPTVCR